MTEMLGQYGYKNQSERRIERKDISGRIKMTLAPGVDRECEFTNNL